MNVVQIAKLAHVTITNQEEKELEEGFKKTLGVVDKLSNVDVSNIAPYQVPRGVNVFRDDEVDTTRMFSQEQALMNAKQTHNGFFVVPQIIEQE